MRTSRSKNANIAVGKHHYFRQWLRHHRYAIANVLKSLWQSRWTVTINSIILGVSLALPLALISITNHFEIFSQSLNPPLKLYLQLGDAIGSSPPENLFTRLSEDPRVATLTYISREEVLKRVLQQLDIEPSSSLTAINPFTNTISVTLAPKTSSGQGLSSFVDELQSNQGILQVDTAELSKVSHQQKLLALLHRFAYALCVVFLFSSLLVCGYMVRNQIVRQHLEIEVTRYCGADKAFIQRPFLYWGAVQGCLGAVCAGVIVYGCFALFIPPMNALSRGENTDTLAPLFYLPELLIALAAGSLLGLIGAWIATKLHLNATIHTEIR